MTRSSHYRETSRAPALINARRLEAIPVRSQDGRSGGRPRELPRDEPGNAIAKARAGFLKIVICRNVEQAHFAPGLLGR